MKEFINVIWQAYSCLIRGPRSFSYSVSCLFLWVWEKEKWQLRLRYVIKRVFIFTSVSLAVNLSCFWSALSISQRNLAFSVTIHKKSIKLGRKKIKKNFTFAYIESAKFRDLSFWIITLFVVCQFLTRGFQSQYFSGLTRLADGVVRP